MGGADAPGVIDDEFSSVYAVFLPHCSDDDAWEPVDDYELVYAEFVSTAIEQRVIEPPHITQHTPFFFSISITCFLITDVYAREAEFIFQLFYFVVSTSVNLFGQIFFFFVLFCCVLG